MEQLDSGIAVHPYTGIHMWISWTLGLHGIAIHSTNMQINTEQFQIIHTQQFCNQPKWCA